MRLITAFRVSDQETVNCLGPELYERSRRSQYDQFARVYPLYQAITSLRQGEAETAHVLLTEAQKYVRKTQDAAGHLVQNPRSL